MFTVTKESSRNMPALAFPCGHIPALYRPETTVIELQTGQRINLFQICYLRRPNNGKRFGIYDDKSTARIAAFPNFIAKLSEFCRVRDHRPATQYKTIKQFLAFIAWIDSIEHAGRYTSLLADPDLSLEAIISYNAWLKALVQTGKISINTASYNVVNVRNVLSALHEREYENEVEVLATSSRMKTPTAAAELSDVQILLSALASAFDLCALIYLKPNSIDEKSMLLRLTGEQQDFRYVLRKDIDRNTALDLACLSFAMLAIGDSGTNLAQIVNMDYSTEIQDQLNDASIVTLRRKEVKFRAGGKEVPVHFTSVIRHRFQTYLQLRESMLTQFPNDGLETALFLSLKFSPDYKDITKCTPTGVRRVSNLLGRLRGKFQTWFGAQLPAVTLRQLRLHTGNAFTEIAGPKVAAERLGHSLSTAIRNYNNGPKSKRNSEFGEFFSSVARGAVAAARASSEVAPSESELVTGVCKGRGSPVRIISTPDKVDPDCRTTEGCLFCEKYRVHADETDIRKLLSCSFVMSRIAIRSGAANDVEAIYDVIMTRVHSLLDELNHRNPTVFKAVEADVRLNQKLSPYWEARFRQLSMLGLVSNPAQSTGMHVE